MEEIQTRSVGKRGRIRLLAFVLAIAAICSVVLASAAAIKNRESDDRAAQMLLDNTEYAQKSGIERVGDVIKTAITVPDSVSEYYELASVQIGQAKYAEALESINKCIELCPTDSELIYELYLKQGCLLVMTGDDDAALLSFERLPADTVYAADAALVKAQVYITSQDYALACSELNTYLGVYPDSHDIRAMMGDVCFTLGSYSDAAAHYARAIRGGYDTTGEKRVMRAVALLQINDVDGALEGFLDALDAGYADTSVCYSQCAVCAYMKADYASVLDYGEKALASPSDSVSYGDLYYYMGIAALDSSMYSQAEAYFTLAAENNTVMSDSRYYRGVCLMALEQYDAAIEQFNISLELEGETALLMFNRGVCYLQKGDVNAGKADMLRVSELDPQSEIGATANELLAQLG